MKKYSTVYVDIDTQNDFIDPHGSLPVPDGHRIYSNLGRLVQHAGTQGIPVISSVCAHKEGDPPPIHCVMDTWGYLKLGFTLLPRRVTLPALVHVPQPDALLDNYQQIILQKHVISVFTNVNADPLVRAVDADSWVLFGVATEYSVQEWVRGFLERGKRVRLVTDAILPKDSDEGRAVLEALCAQGAETTTTEKVISA